MKLSYYQYNVIHNMAAFVTFNQFDKRFSDFEKIVSVHIQINS